MTYCCNPAFSNPITFHEREDHESRYPSWLHDTGGNNAIKRFSNDAIAQQHSSATQPAAKVTLSKNNVASLSVPTQYNQAAQLVGFASGNVVTLSSLATIRQHRRFHNKSRSIPIRTNFNQELKSTNHSQYPRGKQCGGFHFIVWQCRRKTMSR